MMRRRIPTVDKHRNTVRVSMLILFTSVMFLNASLQARDNRPPGSSVKNQQDWIHSAAPIFDRRLFNVGALWQSFTNDGRWGTSHGDLSCPADEARLRINWCPSAEFPGGTRVDYLFNGGIWIGGVIGADTLVSVAYDGWDGIGEEFNGFSLLETEPPPGYKSPGCVGDIEAKFLDQYYYTEYSDTSLVGGILAATHTPLGVKVRQSLHQSTDNFARSFVISDIIIENIGTNTITGMYVGIFNDCDIFYQSDIRDDI